MAASGPGGPEGETRGAGAPDAAPSARQRLVVRYAKRGKMRFASHRDVARAVERGVRRAGLPVAYSAGFTPHPKISYAGAAPTGAASEAEYLELTLTEACVTSDVADRLDAALPSGIDVIDVTEQPGALAASPLEASQWLVTLPGVAPEEAARAVEAFLASASVEVERLTSKGTRRVDARAAVVELGVGRRAADERDIGYAILRMVVRHLTPAVRPDDILAGLRRVAALAPSSPPLVTRLAQGALRAEAAGAADADGRDAPAGRHEPGEAAPQPPRRGAAEEQMETTRFAAEAAATADALPGGACDQLPRGAAGPERTAVPGSPTGDCPDARQRAARQRVRR